MAIKTFRGLVAHGGQDTIVLHTNTGSTGYRIVKFEMMQPEPGIQENENIFKIYKVSQSTITGTIDFSDNTLIAAGNMTGASSGRYVVNSTIIFDQEIFNQDIYITQFDADGNNGTCNYYLELEQVKLDLNQNTVATLKDIRNVTAP